MERQKKVIDSSIVVKWFSHEEGSEEALQLRDEHILGKIVLVAPELIFWEVINALRYKNNDEQKLVLVNKILWETQFHIEKINDFLLNKIISVALKYKLSFYDATYLALAVSNGCPLVTADKELLKTENAVKL